MPKIIMFRSFQTFHHVHVITPLNVPLVFGMIFAAACHHSVLVSKLDCNTCWALLHTPSPTHDSKLNELAVNGMSFCLQQSVAQNTIVLVRPHMLRQIVCNENVFFSWIRIQVKILHLFTACDFQIRFVLCQLKAPTKLCTVNLLSIGYWWSTPK